MNIPDDLFANWQHAFDRLGIQPTQVEYLARYCSRLWAHNQEINLVSRKMDPETLLTDHLLDSLIGLPYFPGVRRVADLGSGGGFPSIPLAICRPDVAFLLYEKSPLKRRFLDGLRDLAPNTATRGILSEQEPLEEVDLVMARGFKSIKQILNLSTAHRRKGGRFWLYKGRRARIDEELAEVGDRLEASIQVLQSYGKAEERHLVIF